MSHPGLFGYVAAAVVAVTYLGALVMITWVIRKEKRVSRHSSRDRVTGWASLWLIAASVWGFATGQAPAVLGITGSVIVMYAVGSAVFERRDRKRNEEEK